jgi:hypothetical protein
LREIREPEIPLIVSKGKALGSGLTEETKGLPLTREQLIKKLLAGNEKSLTQRSKSTLKPSAFLKGHKSLPRTYK